MTTTPFIVEVEAKAVDLLCLFCRTGDTEKEGALFNSQYSGRGKDEGARERERNRKGGRGSERASEKVAAVEGDLPCRMIERGGEEAELHQMKWGENNSGINQAWPKGGCSFFLPSLCGSKRRGVNEELESWDERTTGHYPIMSESNSSAACMADQVSCVFVIFVLFLKRAAFSLFYRRWALPRGKFENERVRASTSPDASKRQLYEAARTTVQGPERTELIKTKHCLQCLIFRPSFRGPVTTQ